MELRAAQFHLPAKPRQRDPKRGVAADRAVGGDADNAPLRRLGSIQFHRPIHMGGIGDDYHELAGEKACQDRGL